MAVAADTGARVNHVEAGAAGWTPQHRTAQSRTCQRAQTTRTPVEVCEYVITDPARHHSRARHPEAADLTVGQLGARRNRLPWVPARVHPPHQRLGGYHVGRGFLVRGNDFDRGDLWRGGPHRVLHRKLQRDRRRWATLATALELKAD